MSTFKKYPKIHRLGKDETIGILAGDVHVQEKIDGANASVWLDKRGEITCGSRSRELSEGFNGFVDYVKNNEELLALLKDNPGYRLCGEWLVKHSISYNETAYKKFYMFDIAVIKDGEEEEQFLPIEEMYRLANEYGIPTPHYHGKFTNPAHEELEKMAGMSVLGESGEGVVIKNDEFINKFGLRASAKIVTQEFKESNSITFGGNNKHSDTYWEMYIINKYMTLPRVEKIMHKIQPLVDEKLDMEHAPRVINTAYHDMITEEIWEIQKKARNVDFMMLRKLATRKAAKIYHDILNNHISVAYEESNNS